jgi:beta-hydroxyacyl-ACP dehydratase FabZ
MTDGKTNLDTLDIRAIMDTIPHRYPFLLVDRVIELRDDPPGLVAIKNVTMNEPYFTGHYPGRPIMPGVLQIEAMAQAACIWLLLKPENAGKVPLFAAVDGVRFRKPVVPGDQIRIEAFVERTKGRITKAATKCIVDGEVACEATLTCVLGDPE